MNTTDLLPLSVSYQSQIWLPIEKEVSIGNVLTSIQSGELDREIMQIRDSLAKGDMESFAMHKRSLPAVTFCASFDGQRKTEFLKDYNAVMVLDIDKLDPEELETTAAILQSDPYVFAYWVSPSGKGFKGLVALEYSFALKREQIANTHKKAFGKLSHYFFEHYGLELDESGCDITRLCFLSSDPDLVMKQVVDPFLIEQLDLIEVLKPSSSKRQPDEIEDKRRLQFKNKPEEKALVASVIEFLQKENLSITDAYEQWYRVAYALSEAFTYKLGLDYYLQLCAMDGNRFDEPASREMFHYCYKNADGRIKLNSLLYYATKLGFKA